MKKAQKQTKVNQEGYGIGVTTVWGVVENGEINPWNIHPTRQLARQEQKELAWWEDGNKYSVRKLEIRVVEGR